MFHHSSKYPHVAADAAGNPLHEGDMVASLTHPGDHRDAPVYRVALICTDGRTLCLSRADGSHLWRDAAEVLYFPETTAATQP